MAGETRPKQLATPLVFVRFPAHLLPSVQDAMQCVRNSGGRVESFSAQGQIVPVVTDTPQPFHPGADNPHGSYLMNKTLIAAAAIAMAGMAATVPAIAADEYNTSSGLTAAGAPLGLHGIDPVAFLDIGNRQEGTAVHTAVHDGVAYYFTSEANKDTFEANPAKYLPQNGGFCTFGVSVGKKFDGDPAYADVMDGKLYVFLSEEIFKAYQKDKAGTIAKAEANWKKIQNTKATEL